MRASVILSTYNSPAWLEKVLWGYQQQDSRAFELIVADDGSNHSTEALVRRMQKVCDYHIRHVWQRDAGFRKCRILNKAIRASSLPYLVFSDGDCIPRRDFVSTHLRRAEPGYYLSGTYFKLPMSTSCAITLDDIESGRCFELNWLHHNGLPRNRGQLKLGLSPRAAQWMNRLTPVRCNLKGSNASVWREDALRVNGMDERMAWGGEDREFGVRLINAGIRPRHVRFDAICLHLDHSRGYADPARVAANLQLRRYNERHGVSWTDHGLS